MIIENRKQKPNIAWTRPTGGMIAFSVLFVFLIAMIFIFAFPAFHISTVSIEGCDNVDVDRLLQESGIKKGDHILKNISGNILSVFSFRYENIEENLKSEFPFIDSVSVRADYPSSVKVLVKERQKIGYIRVNDGYIVIDREGYVVEMNREPPPENVPVFSGIDVRSAVLSEKIILKNERQLDTCIAILNAVIMADKEAEDTSGFSLASRVSIIRYVDENTSILTLRDADLSQDLVVRLGTLEDLRENMKWLRYAMMNQTFKDVKPVGVLDMSGKMITYR